MVPPFRAGSPPAGSLRDRGLSSLSSGTRPACAHPPRHSERSDESSSCIAVRSTSPEGETATWPLRGPASPKDIHAALRCAAWTGSLHNLRVAMRDGQTPQPDTIRMLA